MSPVNLDDVASCSVIAVHYTASVSLMRRLRRRVTGLIALSCMQFLLLWLLARSPYRSGRGSGRRRKVVTPGNGMFRGGPEKNGRSGFCSSPARDGSCMKSATLLSLGSDAYAQARAAGGWGSVVADRRLLLLQRIKWLG